MSFTFFYSKKQKKESDKWFQNSCNHPFWSQKLFRKGLPPLSSCSKRWKNGYSLIFTQKWVIFTSLRGYLLLYTFPSINLPPSWPFLAKRGMLLRVHKNLLEILNRRKYVLWNQTFLPCSLFCRICLHSWYLLQLSQTWNSFYPFFHLTRCKNEWLLLLFEWESEKFHYSHSSFTLLSIMKSILTLLYHLSWLENPIFFIFVMTGWKKGDPSLNICM